MASRVACMLLVGLPPVLCLKSDSDCGGVHCFGTSVYCCTSSMGVQTCCQKPVYGELWFWALVVIGVLVIATVLFCVCRAVYRYHNAGQYTKLRLQNSVNYGSISGTVANMNIPPPPMGCWSESDDLPTYEAVTRMPPAYSETNP